MVRLFGVVALAVLLLAGSAGAATEVTLWHSITNPVDSDAIQAIADKFNASQDDIRVKVVQVPGAETDVSKLMTAVAGGTGPDIYYLDRFTVAQRAAAGLLEDLTGFIKADGVDLAPKYIPFAWQEVLFRDHIYGLPFDTDARVLFYRPDLLKAAGVDPNVLDPANGPITPQQLRKIAAKVNQLDASGNYSRLGMVPDLFQGWHYTWGYAYGGSFYDPKTRQLTPDHPGVVAGYKFLQDWYKADGISRVQNFIGSYAPFARGATYNPAQDPFISGRVALKVDGDWFLATIARFGPDVPYGVTYIPTPDGSKVSWSGGWSLVIPKGSKHAKEAYQALRFFTGPEGQELYSIKTTHLPTWKDLMNNQEVLGGKNHQFFVNLLPYSKSRPALPVGAEYWDELTSAMQKVLLGQLTPQKALAEVKARVQPDLDRLMSK